MEDVNYMQVPSELVFLLLGEGDKCGKVNENLNIYKKGKNQIINPSQMVRHARIRKRQNLQRQTGSKGDFRRCRHPQGHGRKGT